MFPMKCKEKELRMIWEVEKNNKTSFLVGTAHFFPYSFRNSLSRYIKYARTVLFEGPLDDDNMSKVVKAGLETGNAHHLFDKLDRQTIDHISKATALSSREENYFFIFSLFTSSVENHVYTMVKGMKPWLAFFTIWSKFLEKNGWRYSVDTEAYGIAREMGKKVVFLETIEEQIEVLESLVPEQIIDFLRRVDRWNVYAQDYVKWYLDGDLEKIKSNVNRFPTRHPYIIDRRDQILYERMLAYLEVGDAVVCVGAPHVRGISRMLLADGYQIKGRCPRKNTNPHFSY
ncbi:MAG: TraB/GumN family protein [Deltaproteobacteria bacterium]|nr:TraB/GumN family protein [Deltaproteobacteria bacterium]